MPETDLLLLFTRPLERAELRYFITGSMAGIIYGEPRLTMDVDLVLVLPPSAIGTVLKEFDEAHFYCPPFEILRQEAGRPQRGHFNLIHHDTGFKADVYLAGQDPFHEWAFSRLRMVRLGDDSVSVAPPEYVIVRKLEFYDEGHSEKHLRDIHSMIERSKEEIDGIVLRQLIEERGLESVWQSFTTWSSP